MDLRTSALAERLRSSLFFVPTAFVFLGLILGSALLEVDDRLLENRTDLPFRLTSTVDSARAVLTVVASATITVAGIAFSISLLVIQLASSQYSPRVVPGLFRDPFNKRVMGVVVGTFTYCLVVLRAVRASLADAGEPVIPNVSVTLAVILGIASIMAIVAFIDHSAHAMDVSRILHDLTDDAVRQVQEQWRAPDDRPGEEPAAPTPPTDVFVVPLHRHGWVQSIDLDDLGVVPDPGGTVRVETSVGRYAVAGTPLCTVWPRPHDEEAAAERARRSLVIGEARTSPQDVAYGVRQLADVALRALSPGVNDPTTAQDAMFHLGSVLRELCAMRPPPARRAMPDHRTLLVAEGPTHEDLVGQAFDEVRIASTEQPTVSIYLLEIIRLLVDSLDDEDSRHCRAPLLRQARLIRDGAERSSTLLPADVRRVVAACDQRFGSLDPVR